MLKLKGFLLSLARYTRLIKQDAGLHLLSASCGACAPGGPTIGVDWGNRKSASRQQPTARRLFCDAVDVVGPSLQRIAHRLRVRRSIINTSNPALVATYVVKDCFNDVGLHAKLGHAGGAGAAKIVECVRCDHCTLI